MSDNDCISISNNRNPYNNSNGAVHGVVIGTCCLSILGTLLIISTYVFYKEMRTTVRLVLVHLSFMDLGIAVVHLLGVVLQSNGIKQASNETWIDLCKTQAAFAIYFTLGSFFWTSCLAVYLYFRIVHYSHARLNKAVLMLSYIISYGCPALLAVWAFSTNRIGLTKFTGGWCGQKLYIEGTDIPDRFGAIFLYDLWQYLTVILATVVYISVHIHIHQEFSRSRMFVSSVRFWGAFHNVDYKFLFIPIAFSVLRVWSGVMFIIYIYFPCLSAQINAHWFILTLPYLQGMGDSGQGFLNGFLFVVFTKRVRQKIIEFVKHPCRKQVSEYSESAPILKKSNQEQRPCKESSLTQVSHATFSWNDEN